MQVFVFGGSGSGKSTFAENLAAALAPGEEKIYIATMWPHGQEARQRIARHQTQRAGKGFTTVERYTALADLQVPQGSTVLLECLGNWLANEMFAPQGAAEKAAQAVEAGLACLRRQGAHLVVVSNDVGSDGAVYPPETQHYQQTLAEINRGLCQTSPVAVEMVCGIPIFLKGESLCPSLLR